MRGTTALYGWFRSAIGLALLASLAAFPGRGATRGSTDRHRLGVPTSPSLSTESGAQRPESTLVIENPAARLVIDRNGGVLRAFQLRGDDLNPLAGLGHFLCLDRWGQPSAAEEKNGMPFHGEASKVAWRVVRPPQERSGAIEVEMAATLPLAGLEVKRRIRLAAAVGGGARAALAARPIDPTNSAVVTVREEVTNLNKLGRVYNIVQHPTVGPPFLDEGTLVDANAGLGFMQSSPLPKPEQPSVRWPAALKAAKKPGRSVEPPARPAPRHRLRVDMRRLTDDPDPNVVSYVIDEPIGWTTVCNPGRRLLLGYLWKTQEYPWFNAWRHVERGKPAFRGLEFGTTGLHQPYPTLVAKGRIFDRPLFAYLDAGETAARSYTAFLVRTPAGYRGVARLRYDGGRLRLREHGGDAGREIVVPVGEFPSADRRP